MCALETEEGDAQASDGIRIRYRIAGKGPFALVMPVNWGMDSFVYTKGLSVLEFWLALVTFDPRGVGGSGPAGSPSEFAMEVTAQDAAAVAHKLNLSASLVMGHSSGGAVALTYALRYPERVSHLILLSSAARWDLPPAWPTGTRLPVTEDAMRAQVREAVDRAVREPSRFAKAMDEILPRMRFSPERLRWCAEVEDPRYDLRGSLREIRAPTLILHGKDDPVVHVARARELHEGIPDSRLVLLDDCGHWPFVERRDAFLAAVKEFLGLADVGPRGWPGI